MDRFIINDLRDWKNSKRRKPLILRGARQVGKTWILTEFGKEFNDGYVIINFDKHPEYHQFFETTKDVERIIKNLSFACGQKITRDTLLIFDEIQSCPSALNSLKYFCEDATDVLRQLAKDGNKYDFIFMDAAKGQYINFYEDVMRLLPENGVLVSDNVLQDGDIIQSRYAVTRRNRTIHSRMRDYLYTLTHDERLVTSVIPIGDGVTISVRK